MVSKFEQKIQEVTTLVNERRYEDAITLLDEIEANSLDEEIQLSRKRGHIHCMQGNFDEAIRDISVAISKRDNEPGYFFLRGRYYFEAGRFQSAVKDFTKVLELCDIHNWDYYREASYFSRADAYVRLGKFDKARADCGHVRDDMRGWTDRLRSKEDILADCKIVS